MSRAIHVTAGNHSGARKSRELDQYATPPCTVEALVRAEPLPQVCWEACGHEDSAIAMVLRAHDRRVVCTDITTDNVDFCDRTKAPPGVQALVMNPPFTIAADFVRHGLRLVPKVVVLERIQFLEAACRSDIFDSGHLARIHVFRDRVPRMHRVDWDGKRASPSMLLAWFVFERDHTGNPELDWITCGAGRQAKRRGIAKRRETNARKKAAREMAAAK